MHHMNTHGISPKDLIYSAVGRRVHTGWAAGVGFTVAIVMVLELAGGAGPDAGAFTASAGANALAEVKSASHTCTNRGKG